MGTTSLATGVIRARVPSAKALPSFNRLTGCRSIPAAHTHPPCHFSSQTHDAQKDLIDSLTAIPREPIAVLTLLSDSLDNFPEDERPAISDIVNGGDPLALIPITPRLLTLYASSRESNPALGSVLLQTLGFVASFPVCQFAPRDCALEAYNVGTGVPSSIAPTLLAISRVTTTDFIDRGLADKVEEVLSGSGNLDVQRVRWMYRNIVPSQRIDDQNLDPVIERSIEVPEEDPSRKPQPTLTLHEIIKTARRVANKIAAILKTKPPVAGTWPEGCEIDAILRFLTDMEKRFADIKIIQKAAWLGDVCDALDTVSQLIGDWSKDEKRYLARLQELFGSLHRFCSYLNSHGRFTVNSVSSVLEDADAAVVAHAQESENPLVISRSAWIREAICKIAASVLHPLANERMISGLSPILLALHREIDSPEGSLFVLIAEWIVRTQDLVRPAPVIHLHDMSRLLRIAALELAARAEEIEDQDLVSIAGQLTGALDQRSAEVDQLADNPDQGGSTAMRDTISALRGDFQRVLRRSSDFGLGRELAAVASSIETSLAGMQAPSLRRTVIPVDEPAPSASPGRVSFLADQTAFLRDTDADYGLLPVLVRHPVYDAWDTERFREAVRPTQSIPIDVQLLKKVTMSKLGGRQRLVAARQKVGEAASIRALALTPDPNQHSGSPEEESRAIEVLERLAGQLEDVEATESLLTKLDWLEDEYPLLQLPRALSNANVSGLYIPLSTRFNALIEAVAASGQDIFMPRPAVSTLRQRVGDVVSLLGAYQAAGVGGNDETIVHSTEAWRTYLSEIVRILALIEQADDEVTIHAAKDFIITFKSSLASLAHPAELIDQAAHRRSLGAAISVVTRLVQVIFAFTSSIQTSDLCTITDAQTQLRELTRQFDETEGLASTRRVFVATASDVAAILEAPDVNTSTADDACQRLKAVSTSLEAEIRTRTDAAYSLFVGTVGLRVSLKNLHVSDAEPDQFLGQLAGRTVTDLFQVSNALAAARESPEARDFAIEWVTHVDECKVDLEGVQRVAAIVISSPLRRPVIAENLDAIRRSLLPIEDEHFPLSVPPYRNLTHHLERMIAYVKTTPDRPRQFRRNEDDDALSIQMNFMSMGSLAVGGYKSTMFSVDDFKIFSRGFLRADPRTVQSTIRDNLSRGSLRSSIGSRINVALAMLFTAHVDSFARDYGIGPTSTRVCFELILRFCAAIIDCAPKSATALDSRDLTELEAAVFTHATAIQEVQQQYTDKPTYSEFGHHRLLILAHTCCVLAQLSALNVFHLSAQEQSFVFDELKLQVPQVLQQFGLLPTEYPAIPVFDQLQGIEQLSVSITYDESPDRIVRFLTAEAKFCEGLRDVIDLVMVQADLRRWKLGGVPLELSSPVIGPAPTGTEVPDASQVKRNFQVLNDSIVEFGTGLGAAEVEEDVLSGQITALDNSSTLVCQKALMLPSDAGFKQLVHTFRGEVVQLVNRLKQLLFDGTYNLLTADVDRLLDAAKGTTIQLIRHLGIMVQVEEEVDMSVLLTRLIKGLYFARDELVAVAKKKGSEPVILLAELTGAGYAAIAQVLLTVKNSGPRVERALRHEKIAVLRQLLFSAQSVLNAAVIFEKLVGQSGNEPVESPEFLFKAGLSPVLSGLRILKKSIPAFVPNAAMLNHAMGSIILDMAIAIEPRFEERPMLGING